MEPCQETNGATEKSVQSSSSPSQKCGKGAGCKRASGSSGQFEIGFVSQHCLDAPGEMTDTGLGHSTLHTGVLGHLGQLGGQVHGAHEQAHTGNRLVDFPGGFQPVQPRHKKIQDNQVRSEFLSFKHGIATVYRFAADLPLWVVLHECTQAMPHMRIIVSNQYAYHLYRLYRRSFCIDSILYRLYRRSLDARLSLVEIVFGTISDTNSGQNSDIFQKYKYTNKTLIVGSIASKIPAGHPWTLFKFKVNPELPWLMGNIGQVQPWFPENSLTMLFTKPFASPNSISVLSM